MTTKIILNATAERTGLSVKTLRRDDMESLFERGSQPLNALGDKR